jgi:phosphomannomutase|tara:strand:+ start:141 stop:857 length:717 start_codon:yes stop_codon:yes gene_type:complete
MKHYIFDVDGTLTPSRGKIDEEFSKLFFDFCCLNKVYLVTGSDVQKTREQVGNVIWGMTKRNYQCSGNDVWERGKNIRTSTLKLPDTMWGYLNKEIANSKFPIRTGMHIEERPGLFNFSILGRNPNSLQRSEYVAWDEQTEERKGISKRLSDLFPEFNFQIAGETGIDITAKGNTKAQILADFSPIDDIWFYGDNIDEGGNDHEIAKAVEKRGGNNLVFRAIDWKYTMSYLQLHRTMV